MPTRVKPRLFIEFPGSFQILDRAVCCRASLWPNMLSDINKI
jgi:hypothetical protein